LLVLVFITDELLEATKKYIYRSIAYGSLTLQQLAKIESKVVEETGFPNFPQLGRGNFLDFLLENDVLKTVSS